MAESTYPPSSSSLLNVLREDSDAFRSILSFVQDPYQLRRLGHTCRTFHEYLYHPDNDKEVWKYIFKEEIKSADGVDYRITTAREKIFLKRIANKYQQQQQGKECGINNIFLSEFEADDRFENGMKTFLQHCIAEFFNNWTNRFVGPDFGPEWWFRNDTTTVFAEILQANILHVLARAFDGTVYRTSDLDEVFPVLEKRDLEFVDQVSGWNIADQTYSAILGYSPITAPHIRPPLMSLDDMRQRVPCHDRVVRLLSIRAGIFKLNDDAYNYVWDLILQVTTLLLLPLGLEHHAYTLSPTTNPSRPDLQHPASIHMMSFPPNNRDVPCMPAPNMVEEAAKQYNMPITKAYVVEKLEDNDNMEYDELYDIYFNSLDKKSKASIQSMESYEPVTHLVFPDDISEDSSDSSDEDHSNDSTSRYTYHRSQAWDEDLWYDTDDGEGD